MPSISAILLGSGESKRMGKEKLSLPWGKKTIFERSLQTLLRARVSEVIIVLNDRTKEMARCLDQKGVKMVVNPAYRKGMSSSIRSGMKVLDPKSEGILIALGDQPLVKAQTINALIRAFEKGERGIIVPSFKGRRGHPVIFHRRYEKELLRLEGDVGGKPIMEKHPHDVREVPVKSEGVVKDIDTREEYRRELRRKG